MDRLGFFRPIASAAAEYDKHIQLLSSRFNLSMSPQQMVGVTHEQAREWLSQGDDQRLFREIIARFKQAEASCDFLLCEGPDISLFSDALDYSVSVRIAKSLGAPAIYVSSGQQMSIPDLLENIQLAQNTFKELNCPLLAVLVNRVDPDILHDVHDALLKNNDRTLQADPLQINLLPEIEGLSDPAMEEIIEALNAKWFSGPDDRLQPYVRNIKVAAMAPDNFLSFLEKDDLIITPGDRTDIIITTLGAVMSNNYPSPVGIILTGGITPAPPITRLLEGLGELNVPIYSVAEDTFRSALQAAAVKGTIRPGNEGKIARALGIFESHVDTVALNEKIRITPSTTMSPLMFEYSLFQQARITRQHIVLPEGNDERILQAAEILRLRDVVDLTLLGNQSKLRARATTLGLRLEGVNIIDPQTSDLHETFSKQFFELRQHKGITLDNARDTMRDVSYFGSMMVYMDMADGMVSGAAHTTAHTIRPAFQFIGTQSDALLVSSVFLMCMDTRVLVYGDCAVNPNPDSEQLADIAIRSAKTAQLFGIKPVVAMLSYSSGSSGAGEDVERVREAVKIARQRQPDLIIDGPIQYDAAIDAAVADKKMPDSDVAGKASVFIFPDLNTGNNTYKAVQRSSGAVAIGPVLQGLNKPVNDLSRGCLVADIINTVAITAIQAQRVDS
ncbi:BioD-like N-terminal domain / Phosphate acetyltransferase [hydrothermal vent metagenome]|uniref:Phosphate acetyltransferase n=1 Tax=hydrothermal vent metagenome TaxID=652676 RepID=A0A3B0XD74_9ZZZZ